MTILPGETVTFSYPVGDGQNAHNVAFYTFSARSRTRACRRRAPSIPGFPVAAAAGVHAPGAVGRHCRSTTGTYSFYCTVHADMTGTVIVAAASNTPPTVTAVAHADR